MMIETAIIRAIVSIGRWRDVHIDRHSDRISGEDNLNPSPSRIPLSSSLSPSSFSCKVRKRAKGIGGNVSRERVRSQAKSMSMFRGWKGRGRDKALRGWGRENEERGGGSRVMSRLRRGSGWRNWERIRCIEGECLRWPFVDQLQISARTSLHATFPVNHFYCCHHQSGNQNRTEVMLDPI